MLLKVYVRQHSHAYGDVYSLAKCETCENPLLYQNYNMRLGDGQKTFGAFYYSLNKKKLLYPKLDHVHQAVPPHVAMRYSEALKIKAMSPVSFAAAIRRCMETVCGDKGVDEGSLTKSLKALQAKGIVPGVLAEMTDVLRLLGNAGAHDDIEIDENDADTIEEFFKAVLDYVYVRPHQLKEIRERYDKAKAAHRRRH